MKKILALLFVILSSFLSSSSQEIDGELKIKEIKYNKETIVCFFVSTEADVDLMYKYIRSTKLRPADSLTFLYLEKNIRSFPRKCKIIIPNENMKSKHYLIHFNKSNYGVYDLDGKLVRGKNAEKEGLKLVKSDKYQIIGAYICFIK